MALPTADSRVIVIGDTHGCLDELQLLLEKCKYSQELGDVVVLVGDLTNKGPHAAELVRLAVDHQFHAVSGNHDIIALERWDVWRRTGDVPPPDEHGDWEFVRFLRDQDIEYLRGLPLTITLPDLGNTLVVHAGLVPGVPLDKQSLLDMVMIRNVVVDDTGTAQETPHYLAHYKVDAGEPWAKAWDAYVDSAAGDLMPPFVVFGHDAPRGLQQYRHVWGVDTNCCNGGHLTACILPERQIVQVPATGKLHPRTDIHGTAREWRPLDVSDMTPMGGMGGTSLYSKCLAC